MTGSKHTYTATLLTDPEVELHLVKAAPGRIILDAGSAPHVTGSLRLTRQSQAILDALDPRETPRVRLDVSAVTAAGPQARSFDLGIRTRARTQDGQGPDIPIASDEALLSDFAPLADDDTPVDLAASLRDVIDYVLGVAIPGAALAASPASDADMTAYWSLTNLVTNPGAETTTGFVVSGGSSALGLNNIAPLEGANSIVWNASGAAASFLQVPNESTCRPGEVFSASAYLRANNSPARTGRILLRFTNDAGALLGDFTSDAVPVTWTNSWLDSARPFLTVTAPPGATKVFMFLRQDATAAGQQFGADGIMLYRGDRKVPFFSGATVGGGYTYAWGNGGVNASTSTRTPDIERSPDSLTWPAGQSAIDFLHPLVQAAGYRLVCDEARAWTLRGENYLAPGSLNVRYGVNLVSGSDTISRDSGLWFDAAVARYRWKDRDGIQQERIDAYPAPGTPYTLLRLFEFDTPYPGPGFAEYAVRRAQGRGREVTATLVADWRARAEMPSAIRLDGAPTQTGNVQRVEFDLSRDEMTVEGRTTDTPEHAWLLQPAAAWTTGPVGESWLEAS